MNLYDFSGGMESAAMIYLCQDEIKATGSIVRWADTGKQFPEMADSIAQIESVCGLQIIQLRPAMTFDEFLFEKGGMLRQGYTDCSRRMKRRALREHAESFQKPIKIALGFNADEIERGQSFCARNNNADRTFFFPLHDRNIDRKQTVQICEQAGFTVLLGMYRKMGRFDCFFCPNQRISQAELVMRFYPDLWQEWKQIEKRKGYAILSMSAEAIEQRSEQQDFMAVLDKKQWCSCMGGKDEY
jgi:3'-phosphoadenosine 5'-phosphosulfate sulfotransferase (PAPS reductase)/FAD synthetase